MEYGIQRRSVYLTPPAADDDLDYLLDAFDLAPVYSIFGHEGPARRYMERVEASGQMVRGIIRRVRDHRRIGFTVLYAPPEGWGFEANFGHWEYGVVIPDRKHIEGFEPIHASDAMTHYIVDHLDLEQWWWRIRADDRSSRAIARRTGFRSVGVWATGRETFAFYRLPKAAWDRRRRRLVRAETSSLLGSGDAFVPLLGPPYRPERPPRPTRIQIVHDAPSAPEA